MGLNRAVKKFSILPKSTRGVSLEFVSRHDLKHLHVFQRSLRQLDVADFDGRSRRCLIHHH